MPEEIVRIRKFRPLDRLNASVRFDGGRRMQEIDLAGLFARNRHYLPLLQDREAFAQAAIVEDGLGVAWPVETKWGYLDVSAATLKRIADEQQPMTGAEFAAWRNELHLSLNEVAQLLGVGRRTVMGYLKKDELPAVVSIACRALARDKNLLAAHFVPGRKAARRAA